MYLFIYFLLTIFFFCEIKVNGAKNKQNCSRKILDNCSDKLLMLGDRSFVFPTKMDHMNIRCKKIKGLENCIKDYTNLCLNGDTRNSFNVVIYGITKTNKGYCSSSKRKNAFVSFGECVNRHKKILEKIMDQLNLDFHGCKLHKNPKLRLPLACCNFFKFKHDVINEIDQDCPKESEEVGRLIDSYARDGLNLLCGDYSEDSDMCSKIIDKTPKWNETLTSSVFLLPLVDILNSL